MSALDDYFYVGSVDDPRSYAFAISLVLVYLHEGISFYLNWWPPLVRRWNCLFVCWQINISRIKRPIDLLTLYVSLASDIWRELPTWRSYATASRMHLPTTCIVVRQQGFLVNLFSLGMLIDCASWIVMHCVELLLRR